MWIPDWIYRKQPLIYVAAGLGLLMAFGLVGPVVLSAGLLFAAAALTTLWRAQHRIEPELEADPTTILREEWEERRARRIESMRFDQN
jgi:hypothetical protein